MENRNTLKIGLICFIVVFSAAISCAIDLELTKNRTVPVGSTVDSYAMISSFCDQGSRFVDGTPVEQVKCTSENYPLPRVHGVLSKQESDCKGNYCTPSFTQLWSE